MSEQRHHIDWCLSIPSDVEPSPGPHAILTCSSSDDAPCRDRRWEEAIDTTGAPLKQGECYATAMIEAAGAAQMWAGSDDHLIVDREIDVQEVGEDWIWKYLDEEWAGA